MLTMGEFETPTQSAQVILVTHVLVDCLTMAITVGTCTYIISELLFDNDDMTHGAEEEDPGGGKGFSPTFWMGVEDSYM